MVSSKLSIYIGASLQKARIKKGMTQAQVALASKTNVNYYAKLERGESLPSLSMLERLARALKVDSADLLPF